MSALRLDAVRGQTMAAEAPPVVLTGTDAVLPVGQLLQLRGDDPVMAVTLGMLLGQPVYRVEAAAGAQLYDARTGQVVARRNDLWRVFDFVWMLHIMDYEEREDFNHPLLIVSAATALMFVFTGMFMLFYSFRPQRKPGA